MNNDSREKVQGIIDTLKEEFKITRMGNLSLGNFVLIKNKIDFKSKKCWKVVNTNSEFKLCWITYWDAFQTVDRTGGHMSKDSSDYFVGYIKHNNKIGHTLFKPETFEDKINELFNPVEIDFKQYKKFSRRYYVLSDNETKLRNWIGDEFVELLESLKGFSIEFYKDTCLFRFSKSINLSEARDLCKVGLRLSSIL